MNNGYSVTSNLVKLTKHLDKLADLQKGIVTPIMVHSIPTHRCQLNCPHCCFKNRKDRTADMPIDQFITAVEQFRRLGTKALEFTGGGDPTLWPPMNIAVDALKDFGYHLGLITNGVDLTRMKRWEAFDWVRVSLNTLETRDDIDLRPLKEAGTYISGCYIWHDQSAPYLSKVIEWANSHKIITRLAPDCIKPLEEINKSVAGLKALLEAYPKVNDYVFLSDFNIETTRLNNKCRIHMIKPCLYLDGWIYACPSAELAQENNRQVTPAARICRYDEIHGWYRSEEATKPRILDCSYCKYAGQQDFLDGLFEETEFNEFA